MEPDVLLTTIGGGVLAPDPPPVTINGASMRIRAFVYVTLIGLLTLTWWQHWTLIASIDAAREELRERDRFAVAALVAEPEDRRFLRETLSEMDPLVARLMRRAAERKASYFRERMFEGDELRGPTRTTPPLIEQRTPQGQAP